MFLVIVRSLVIRINNNKLVFCPQSPPGSLEKPSLTWSKVVFSKLQTKIRLP